MAVAQFDTLSTLPGGVILITLKDSVTSASLAPTLTGAAAVVANWTVTGPTQVTVSDVYVSSNSIVVRMTHPLQDAGSYTLNVPVGIMGGGSTPYGGSFSQAFTGVGDLLAIISVSAIEAKLARVMFNAPASDTALSPANYVLSGGISIVSVKRETDLVYLLTTSHQLIGTTYTLTAPGVFVGTPFYPKVTPSYTSYWGVITDTGVYNAAFIQSLPTQRSLATFNNTIEFSGADSVKRAFYAFPTVFGTPNQIISPESWLSWPFSKVATSVVVNSVAYDVYRSDFPPTQSFTTHWY